MVNLKKIASRLIDPLVDIPTLPGGRFGRILERGLEELSSPVSLAAIAAAPFTGGGSLAARGALAGRFAPGLARGLAKGAGIELAAGLGAAGAQEAAGALGAPAPLQLAAGLAGGIVAPGSLARGGVVRKGLRGIDESAAQRAIRQADPTASARAASTDITADSFNKLRDSARQRNATGRQTKEIQLEVEGITSSPFDGDIDAELKVLGLSNTPKDLAQQASKREWFHGSSTPALRAEDLSPYASRETSLFGLGTYFTDSEDIARGYAGTKEGSRVYRAAVNPKTVLNLEQQAPSEVLEVFDKVVRSWPDFGGEDFIDLFEEGLQRSLKSSKQRFPATTNLFEAIRNAAREQSLSERISSGEYIDLFAEISDELGELFEAMTHTGGLRVGTGTHRVLIVLRPSVVREFSETFSGSRVAQLTKKLEEVIGQSRRSNPNARIR